MNFYFNDLYPGYNYGMDTDTKSIPEAGDQEVLLEASKETASVATGQTKPSAIMIGIVAIIALVIFMGV